MRAKGSARKSGADASPVQQSRKKREPRRAVTFGQPMEPTSGQNPGARRVVPGRSSLRTAEPAPSDTATESDSDMTLDDDLIDGKQADEAERQGVELGHEPNIPKTRSIHGQRQLRSIFQATQKQDVPGAENNGKDEWLLVGIEELKRQLLAFSRCVPKVTKSKFGYVERLLVPENEQLIRYVGALSLGGNKGAADWNELLTDATAREAIVIGVIARALKEHVFDDYLFGADEDFRVSLKAVDTSSETYLGFERTQERAEKVNGYKIQEDVLEHSRRQIHGQLIKLLGPLWAGHDQMNRRVLRMSKSDEESLYKVVVQAATLAELIRRTPDVVYYWPPTIKDEEFDAARMEATNLQQMIQDSPYDKMTSDGVERAVLRDGSNAKSQAIVRIVAFPAIVAYRQHGGNLAHNEIMADKRGHSKLPRDVRGRTDKHGQPMTAQLGFRTRLINKSVVHLQWGKQRLLTREAGSAAHLDAVRDGQMDKYSKDTKESVELYAWWRAANPGP